MAYLQQLDCPSLSPEPTLFNDAFMTYFCMRHLVCKTTKQKPQPTFYSGIFTAYLCLIFVCVGCSRLVLNQRFLMTYSWLIFLCVGCPSFINQPTFFIDVFMAYFCMRGLSHANCLSYRHHTSLFLVFRKILHFAKFEGADFKYDNSFSKF